jgi:hypothetical protein
VIGRQPPAPAPASGSNTLVSLAALPGDNEFAFIFGMIEEVPNPTLLSLYLAQVDLKTLVTAPWRPPITLGRSPISGLPVALLV